MLSVLGIPFCIPKSLLAIFGAVVLTRDLTEMNAV